MTNDGFLELDEFMRLLEDEKMHLWLSQLQLEYHDLMELFQMIDSGDGRIDWKEFMEGAGRLKGQAKRRVSPGDEDRCCDEEPE